jgi:hypothetical protein
VPIVQEKLVILVARKCFPQLLQSPLSSGMFSDVDMNETSGSDLERDEHIQNAEACRHGNEEVASYRLAGMIAEKGGPALVFRSERARRRLRYLPTVRGESRIWSFSKSSSAIRSSPQVGFSAAMRRIKPLTSADTCGRSTGRDFQRQKRRKAARCQPIKVDGLTMTNALSPDSRRGSGKPEGPRSPPFGLIIFAASRSPLPGPTAES